MAGLFRQELGHFSLIVDVTLPAVKASGASYIVVFVSRIVQRKQEQQQNELVGVPVFWGFRSLCKSEEMYEASLQKYTTHKPNIFHERFPPKVPMDCS